MAVGGAVTTVVDGVKVVTTVVDVVATVTALATVNCSCYLLCFSSSG